ncbi:MAG: hypothetical protein AAFW47_03620 [Pseudomonadota bacterium]
MAKKFRSKTISIGLSALMATTVAIGSISATPITSENGLSVRSQSLSEQQAFARQQLIATVKLYDEHMRVPETGQYLDRIDTHELDQTAVRSSIASTGVGLISLAVGDQMGVVDDAANKAILTLSSLLRKDPGSNFDTPRSRSGWFKHFIDAYTGEGLGGSKHVFSTIDTAILGVGASMVASYFKTVDTPEARKAVELAEELVNTVNWSQAVRFGDRPGVHQIFHGPEEGIENRWWSVLFDEYVILPCLGRAQEAASGQYGRASRFWDDHVGTGGNLPQASFGDLSVLAVGGKRVPSHFTHQFAFYFCGDLAADPTYQSELNELLKADREWFTATGGDQHPDRWWGLGAGSEIKFDKQTGEVKYSAYGVARIGKNPNGTFSPAIQAGFLPVERVAAPTSEAGVTQISTRSSGGVDRAPQETSSIIGDLMTLYENNECRYHFAGLDFLWRCSTRDPSLRVRHIEGVDLSTYLLGLAWFDPSVGPQFFDDHAVKARPSWPEAREYRASVSPRTGVIVRER